MKTKLFFLFLSIFLITGNAYPADRSVTVKPKNSGEAAIQLNTNYYAIIIGNNNYKYFPKLKTPAADAVDVEKILKNKYGFKTKLLLDATRKDILSGINEFRKKLGQNDSLLIYYAGHGEFDKTADKAYWLPVDAQRDNPVDWIMADDITTNIKRITSRHILVVADSCYSGTLTRGASIDTSSKGSRTEFLKKMMGRPSRTLMASGGNEPVSDAGGSGHSVFARAFLTALSETDKGVFTAEEIFHGRIKQMVAGKSEQVPEYSDIRNSGHEGGDFIFQSNSKEIIEEEIETTDTVPSVSTLDNEGAIKDPVTGMEFIIVKGGCYQMGDTFGDGYSYADSKPVHEVCVDDFYIGKYEVTQGQWESVMGNNPSKFKNCGDNCPVEQVSWNDIQEFIKNLNKFPLSKGGYRGML